MSLRVDDGRAAPAVESKPGRRARAAAAAWRALSPGGWLLALTAATGCALAFVGLSVSSYWTDELFTLFVVDHRGGAAEVLRRALTDTHPPTYYLLLYGWSRLFGVGETALRSLSALMAVGAVAVFVRASRGVFTREARAFGAAVAATSPLWFQQAQNIRNYSLCFLLSAAMLWMAVALRRRVRAGAAFPWRLWAGLTAAALLDATTHFYGLLGAGALLFALIVSLSGWRLRAALAASGLLILAVDGAYARLLAAHTHEDWSALWFSRAPARLLTVPNEAWEAAVGWGARWAVLALLATWAAIAGLGLASRRRTPALERPPDAPPGAGVGAEEGRWLAGVCAFVLVAVYAAGVAETLLFAPTLSDQNVLTAAPAAWVLLAVLYDAAVRRLPERARLWAGVAAGFVLCAHGAAIARGRVLERNEPWRESAAFVASAPRCAGAAIPVVQPGRFGPETPFYREITRRWLFGRYLGQGWPRLQPHRLAAFEDPRSPLVASLVGRARDPAACPVLAWAAHDVTTTQAVALQLALADAPGMAGVRVEMHAFAHRHLKRDAWIAQPSAYVFEARRGPGA